VSSLRTNHWSSAVDGLIYRRARIRISWLRSPALCAFADATLAHLPIALSCKLIDFGEHPAQQRLGRDRAYPGSLERLNVFPLAVDLTPHMLDFCSDLWELHGPDLIGLIRTKTEQIGKPLGIGVPWEERPKSGWTGSIGEAKSAGR
jgi:hypothetical protein